MAEEKQPESDKPSISPAPSEVVDKKPEDNAVAPTTPASDSRVQAEALSDGTVPTVISAGESHRSVAKSQTSITAVYRRADILTTLLTFGGVVIALLIIGGGYYLFQRNAAKNTKPAITKVTTLDKAELSKLGSFFDGNSAGGADQILTITSSTLFKNRIATSSDLKVLGGAEISGTTVLGDMTVNKTATLGVVNVNGALGVSGPVNFKGAILIGAGASVNGNLSVTGTGSFGAISATTLTVSNVSITGTFNLAGHLSMSGQAPAAAPGSEAGAGANANVDGNDSAGTVTFNTGTIAPQLPAVGGLFARVTFRTAFPRAPKVIISPDNQASAALQYYVLKTPTGFTIGSNNLPNSNTSYSFDYWVVQ